MRSSQPDRHGQAYRPRSILIHRPDHNRLTANRGSPSYRDSNLST